MYEYGAVCPPTRASDSCLALASLSFVPQKSSLDRLLVSQAELSSLAVVNKPSLVAMTRAARFTLIDFRW